MLVLLTQVNLFALRWEFTFWTVTIVIILIYHFFGDTCLHLLLEIVIVLIIVFVVEFPEEHTKYLLYHIFVYL